MAVRLSVGLILFVIVALLLAEASLSGIPHEQRQGQLLRFSAVALTAGIALAALIDSLVTRPILRLIGQVRSAEASGWDTPLSIPPNRGEITELGQSLEGLRSSIHDHQMAIDKLNSELENRVLERSRELEETQAQLLQAAKLAAVGQLAAGVAHEVNNPTGIMLTRIGFLLTTADEEGLDPELIEDLETLQNQAKRIATITQNLLRFSRRSDLNATLCSLEEIAELTASLLAHTAKQNNTVLRCEHHPSPLISIDRAAIEQVCFNLVKNAIDSGATEVTLHTRANQIQVIDNGCGMNDETRNQIFDPFFTTKEVGKGSGLGLSVSYGIVERHNGELSVTSSPGTGSTFTVTLSSEKHQ